MEDHAKAIHKMIKRKKSVEDEVGNKDLAEKEWGIEIKNGDDVQRWCYTDVLFSFKSMYLLGMKVYYNDLIDLCGRTLRPKNRQSPYRRAYSEQFIEEHINECEELNQCNELQKFIDVYNTIGNVIPMWPGGNAHRGQFECYDNPDIYFNNDKIIEQAKYFFGIKEHSYMIGENCIIDGKYKDLKTEQLLNMDKSLYIKYLKHATDVITYRLDSIKNSVNCFKAGPF